ncbi:MAG: DASS family sodium-coupled anion symporter [Clostridiaceae bacterium]
MSDISTVKKKDILGMSHRRFYSLLIVGIVLAVWFVPTPIGLKPQAWHLFAIFLGTIIAFVAQPMSTGAIALISFVAVVLTNIVSAKEALGYFSNSNTWLIVSAFIYARGFIKTGLGRRIAFLLTKAFGDKTIKLAYALSLSDLIMAPAVPSNTARAGSVLFPIVRSLCSTFKSEPGETSRKIGAFLIQSVFQCNAVTSATFMTAMAANPMVAELASTTLNVQISWGTWLMGAIVPALLSLIVIPLILYAVYPPELKQTPEARVMAAEELRKMGSPSFAEKVMLVVFILSLVFWSTSQYTGLDTVIIALAAICVLLITEVLDWNDVATEKTAWDTFVWASIVLGLAGSLVKVGFIAWFATGVSTEISGISGFYALAILLVAYMYSHYGFASLSAHVSAMYAAFIAVAVTAGVPSLLAALSLGYLSSLCAGLTHYSTGPAPLYFGAGYVDQGTWWKLGFLTSITHLVIWVGIGSIWWKILGFW